MRVATVDLGTNTALLLVAEAADGRLHVLHDEERCPRLGRGVDAAGRIGPEAISRVAEALADYRRTARRFGVEALAVAATSAMRDAANRAEVAARLSEVAGAPVTVLSGVEEATFTFRGVMTGFAQRPAATMLDIGGGSTELAWGTPAGLAGALSVDVGCVRFTERHLTRRPPSPAALESARRAIAGALPARPAAPGPLIAVAGTPTTVAALEAGLTQRAPGAVDDRVLPAARVDAWVDRLAGLTDAQTLALAPPLLAGRADIVLAGTLILAEVVRWLGAPEVVVSDRGLRHGWALEVAARQSAATHAKG